MYNQMSLLSRFPKTDEIWSCSNPRTVQKKAYEHFGKGFKIYRSNLKTKKYFIIDPNGKKVHFGAMNMQDVTYHKDEKRKENYLKRSAGIKGNWLSNPYSPINLSRIFLWDA
jgi:hypothetical protein